MLLRNLAISVVLLLSLGLSACAQEGQSVTTTAWLGYYSWSSGEWNANIYQSGVLPCSCIARAYFYDNDSRGTGFDFTFIDFNGKVCPRNPTDRWAPGISQGCVLIYYPGGFGFGIGRMPSWPLNEPRTQVFDPVAGFLYTQVCGRVTEVGTDYITLDNTLAVKLAPPAWVATDKMLHMCGVPVNGEFIGCVSSLGEYPIYGYLASPEMVGYMRYPLSVCLGVRTCSV